MNCLSSFSILLQNKSGSKINDTIPHNSEYVNLKDRILRWGFSAQVTRFDSRILVEVFLFVFHERVKFIFSTTMKATYVRETYAQKDFAAEKAGRPETMVVKN